MIRFGTRGSPLALAQAKLVVDWVTETHGEQSELVPIQSAGDLGEQIGDKSRWVTALEQALLAGEIDFAIHSAKDVPGELPDGLALLGEFALRGDARDALCGASSLDELVDGARVGTSSLRRRSQLLALRPDLKVVELRGNIDTRLAKLKAGQFDAIVLAAAGLDRLGLSAEIGTRLPIEDFIPAPGQGALVIEGVQSTTASGIFPERSPSACLLEERSFASALGADCHSPIGAFASSKGEERELTVYVGLPDGSRWIKDSLSSNGPIGCLGKELAARVSTVGAVEILAESRAISDG